MIKNKLFRGAWHFHQARGKVIADVPKRATGRFRWVIPLSLAVLFLLNGAPSAANHFGIADTLVQISAARKERAGPTFDTRHSPVPTTQPKDMIEVTIS